MLSVADLLFARGLSVSYNRVKTCESNRLLNTLQAFLDALQNQAEASSTIIGQFGVGFYSAFMVADGVDVYSRSAEPGAPGYKWSSDG